VPEDVAEMQLNSQSPSPNKGEYYEV